MKYTQRKVGQHTDAWSSKLEMVTFRDPCLLNGGLIEGNAQSISYTADDPKGTS